ncbi:hypothetical protein FQR65_LT11826 [Abscondita terminalis]|nr:hypothetical protein FQR65_LT11826 [Abscondita terminalis]
MGPKHKKPKDKKKKCKDRQVPNVSGEAVKKRYDTQITQLNRVLAALRSRVQVVEAKNESIVDENKSEMNKMQKTIKEYELQKESADELCKAKVEELNFEYKVMCEELTMRIRELNDKLFCVYRLQAIRKDMMDKFSAQYSEKEKQLNLNKQELYETEKKLNMEKDRMAKDMKRSLNKLADGFQSIVEICNASQTQKFVNDNVIHNLEYEANLQVNQHFERLNIKYKSDNITSQLLSDLIQIEQRKTVGKAKSQTTLINRLSIDIKDMIEDLKKNKKIENKNVTCLNEIQSLKKKIQELKDCVNVLEQNAHQIRIRRNMTRANIEYYNVEYERVAKILLYCVELIQSFINVPVPTTIPTQKHSDLLMILLTVLDPTKQEKTVRSPEEMILSEPIMYAEGTLGFVPKMVHYTQTVFKEKEINPRMSFAAEPEIMYLNEIDVRSVSEEEEGEGN